MKSFGAFLIGLGALYLFYTFIYIPILPIACIYLTALLFVGTDRNLVARRTFIIIITVISVCLYLYNAIGSIVYYPQYGNVLGIVFDFITAFALLGSGIVMAISATRAKNNI